MDFKHTGKRRRTNAFRGSARFTKRRKTAMAVAKKALRGVREMKRDIETKWNRIAQNNVTVLNTGHIIELIPVAQGVGPAQRNGDKITITGIGIHANVIHENTDAISLTRCMIFVDRQNVIDSKITVAALLEEVLAFSYLKQDRRDRITVLFDKLIMLNSASKTNETFRFWKKVRIQQKYNGAASGDIERNGTYMLLLSDRAVNKPIFQYTALMTFTDT